MKRTLQIAVALVLTALLLVYVVDAREVARVLRNCDPLWALLSLALITADRSLMSFKWGLLLRVRGHNMSFARGMMVYCSAMVWGLALPSTVGADAIRALLVRRQGVELTDSIATILVERAIGFLSALAIGLLSLIVLSQVLPGATSYAGALLLGASGMLAWLLLLVLSFSERAFNVFCGLLPRRWRESRLVTKLHALHVAYRSLAADRPAMAAFAALTVMQQLVSIVVLWCIAQALAVDANALYILAAAPLAFLVARLPISVDGIGVYEAIFVGVMSLSGISPAQAFAIALCGRIFHVTAWLPWFVAYAIRSGTLSPPPAQDVRTAVPPK